MPNIHIWFIVASTSSLDSKDSSTTIQITIHIKQVILTSFQILSFNCDIFNVGYSFFNSCNLWASNLLCAAFILFSGCLSSSTPSSPSSSSPSSPLSFSSSYLFSSFFISSIPSPSSWCSSYKVSSSFIPTSPIIFYIYFHNAFFYASAASYYFTFFPVGFFYFAAIDFSSSSKSFCFSCLFFKAASLFSSSNYFLSSFFSLLGSGSCHSASSLAFLIAACSFYFFSTLRKWPSTFL